MKSFLPSLPLLTRWLAGGALSAAGLLAMAPAQADAYLEPLTNLLSAPGSAGLGVDTHFERSPYREAGNRYDVLPLYLYEGELFFLHANRGGVKLLNGDAQRFELFIEQPGRQRQAGVTQAQLPGPDD